MKSSALKFILLAFVSVYCSFAYSQTETLKMKVGGKDKKTKTLEGVLGVVGQWENGFYMLKSKSKGLVVPTVIGPAGTAKAELTLLKYTDGLDKVDELVIEDVYAFLFGKAKGKSFEFFCQDAEGQMWMFYSDEENGNNPIYKMKFDDSRMKFEEPVRIASIPIKEKLDRRGSFYGIQSDDKSHLAIYSSVGNKKTQKSYVYVEMLDAQLNSKWQSTSLSPIYEEKNYLSTKHFKFMASSSHQNGYARSVSNLGVLNIMQKVIVNAKNKLFSDSSYFLFSFSNANENPKPVLWKFENKEIGGAMIDHLPSGELVASSYYLMDKVRGISGLVYQKLEAESLNEIQNVFVPFSEENKKKFLISEKSSSKSSKRKDEKTLSKIEKGKQGVSVAYKLMSLHTNENGTSTIGFENRSTSTKQNYNPSGNSAVNDFTTYYKYGDLIYVNFSKEGEVNWITNIDKQQTSEYHSTVGVFEMHRGNTLHLVYNLLGKNPSLKYKRVMEDGKTFTKTMADYTSDKDLKKFIYRPSLSSKMNESNYIGLAVGGLKQKVVRFTIE